MNMIEFHSHEQQDEFIYNLFKQKQNGFFLDISCGNPIIGSNTYTLEKELGWTGYGFDIGNCENLYQWSQKRKAQFVKADATSEQLTNFLKENVKQTVDYISLDVDANGTNLALQALKRVLDSGIKFKAMTFEHECYIHGQTIRDEAHTLLETRGLVPLFADVRLWAGGLEDDSGATFEDWYIDPAEFDPDILKISEQGLYYFECVDALKTATGTTYRSHHRCSRAWPEEYNLFWHENEEAQLKQLFSRMTPKG
jgi:hypothetical protein